MIQIKQIQLLRGLKVLLNDASAQIYPGHKVGLIGANGAGKSSLFALLQGQLHVDAGECLMPSGWQIATVAQETPASDASALDYVLDGDKRLRSLQAQLQQAEHAHDGEKIALIHQQLDDAGAYDVQSRAANILAGLGFSEAQMQQAVRAFSGGWRMRLNLAQALICPSDLLLLDEPTNHLDLDAVIWLERWLQKYKGTLILISHDKAFLDATVQHILSIEQQTLFSYTGGYTAYLRQRSERLRQQQIAFERQQEKAAHLQKFIDRFRAKASKARQAQSRIKQLERMAELLPVQEDSPFSFEFAEPSRLPNPLVTMEQVQAGYGEKVILESLKLNLVPGSRIGLLGRNGAGKSTLIKLLAEEIQPLNGQYQTSAGLKIGYFAQHQLEYLRPEDSPLRHLQRLDKQATEQQLRDFLGGFAFHGDAALSPVAPFSGGEKARLVLALLVYQKPNLLLLDEPTNHLDLDMRQALNLALQSFTGAMVLVSHDRFLLESVCDEFYLVHDGQVSQFDGDLNDYRQFLLTQGQQAAQSASPKTSAPAVDRKQQKRLEAEFRQKMAPLKKQLQKLEAQMQTLQADLDNIATQLADPDIYTAEQKVRLTELLRREGELKPSLEEVEMEWMTLLEEQEQQEQAFASQFAGQ